jgi:nucleoside-diphosphate-sugar epimerase
LKSKGNPGIDWINFDSGTEISINKIPTLISKYTNKGIKAIPIESRPVELQRLFADISKAKELFGFKSQYEFVRGLSLLMD